MATETRPEPPAQAPRLHEAADLEELRSWQLVKRRDFERSVGRNPKAFGSWLRYARWEAEENHDYARARSIYERALDADIAHVPLWVHYIRFELALKAVNHARNLLDRAVTVLPHEQKLWFMYVQTEEMLKNFPKTRSVFERWLEWRPPSVAWEAYLDFCRRYRQPEAARSVCARYVAAVDGSVPWLRWSELEQELAENVGNTRMVFSKAADTLAEKWTHGGSHQSAGSDVAAVVVPWAQWEASVGEYARATAILEQALTLDLGPEARATVATAAAHHARLYGSGSESVIDATVAERRVASLEQAVAADPEDYDSWWSLAALAPSVSVFERAVATPPSSKSKTTAWKRYVFLWLRYALHVEYQRDDPSASTAVWKRAVAAVPHRQFTFAKLWIEYARFEIRHHGLAAGRKVLGQAIGKTARLAPKRKLLQFYVDLERRLGEWSRVRRVYDRWLELAVTHGRPWLAVLQAYLEFEVSVGDDERARALVGVAASAPDAQARRFAVDWFTDELLYPEAREVYERTVGAPEASVGDWVAYALWESAIPTDEQLDAFNASDADELEVEITNSHRDKTRVVFTRAAEAFRASGDDQAHIALLQAWADYEQVHGDEANRRRLAAMQPVKTDEGYEFPEVAAVVAKPNLAKFLANAKLFAKKSESEEKSEEKSGE
ncbi:pre-mRNA-splicing factor Clf1p, partial [Diutina catenulata]